MPAIGFSTASTTLAARAIGMQDEELRKVYFKEQLKVGVFISSMEQSVTECRREMERLFGERDDLVRELRYMESQMQVGVPVEQLFWNLGQRSGVEEIRNFGDIFLIARRSGGNLGKILGNLAEVLGEKIRVTGEIQVAIAGKKLEQMVMSLVPGAMILYMQLTSRGFLDVLYHNLPGALVMTGCLGVYLFSFRMGRKIVRIQV